jgi:TatD DNase family protein
MLIDTHAHVNFKPFRDDADDVIKRSLDAATWMILVGTEYKTSKRTLEYANKFEKGVYASVGLHPIHLQSLDTADEQYEFSTSGEDFNYDIYEQLASFEKVVAIGEIGLDYYHISPADNPTKTKQKQKETFIAQLELAMNLDLPVIIHCRQAHDDMYEILSEYRKKYRDKRYFDKSWGVMHCFSGDEDLAWKYFNLGLLISFTGLVTFSMQWDDLLRKIPLDKFLIETDSPFMSPEPFRGKRNEPILVKYVAKHIAEIKGLPVEKIAEVTTKNARNLFNI